jgi:GTPase SAR1 family protein
VKNKLIFTLLLITFFGGYAIADETFGLMEMEMKMNQSRLLMLFPQFRHGVDLSRYKTFEVPSAQNETGKTFELDVVDIFTQNIKASLRENGYVVADGIGTAEDSLIVESSIIGYEPRSAENETACIIEVVLTEKRTGKFIGIISMTKVDEYSQGKDRLILKEVAESIINAIDKKIKEKPKSGGWIGVESHTLTPGLAKLFDLKDANGVLITDVVKTGPADKGGLKKGDVIIEFDGKKILSPEQLKNIVDATKPGKEVKAKIIRGGNLLTLSVIIGEM